MSKKYIDITGMQFGKLMVIKKASDKYRSIPSTAFECVCDCGRKEIIVSYQLRHGRRKACRICIPIKVGATMGSKYRYSSRIFDSPLNRKQIGKYRKKLNNSEYIERASEGAAFKLADIIFGGRL